MPDPTIKARLARIRAELDALIADVESAAPNAPSTPKHPDDDDALLLQTAARLAFLDGIMTVAALRRERDRGTLEVERIGGRDYTTLAAIRQMRQACRTPTKASPRSSVGTGPGSGAIAAAAARRLVQELRTSLERDTSKRPRRST